MQRTRLPVCLWRDSSKHDGTAQKSVVWELEPGRLQPVVSEEVLLGGRPPCDCMLKAEMTELVRRNSSGGKGIWKQANEGSLCVCGEGEPVGGGGALEHLALCQGSCLTLKIDLGLRVGSRGPFHTRGNSHRQSGSCPEISHRLLVEQIWKVTDLCSRHCV